MDAKISRRNFLKQSSIIASTIGSSVYLNPFMSYAGNPEKDLSWDKAPCRFCGTGCSVLVGVGDEKIVAVKGDPKSSVNQGTLCAKGYSLPFIQYGEDRLTRPLIRMKNGVYDKKGVLKQATWEQAFDLMAKKANQAIKDKGQDAVAMFGSGQWTIWEGYAALKLWKAGLRTNSLEVNARHCMASAVAGFMTTFGIDEPMGTYDDFNHADAFILWGANMAEMHPILYSKLANRLMTNKSSKIINLTVFSNRSSDLAEKEIIFKPQSDLAIANGIANLLIKAGKVNNDFIKKHTLFKSGKEKPGYGLEDKFKFKEEVKKESFSSYKKYVSKYTPEYVEKISGVSSADLNMLAEIYGNPQTKVISLWTMGVNQHTRGTWMNNLINNLHLITGKICESGSQPYSLTGQPSACGTCREVGTFTHRLPADMVVKNPEHRKITEKIWKVPEGTIPGKPSYHAVEMMRAIERGDVRFFWSMVANPFQDYANLNRSARGALRESSFVVVSDVYPTRSTQIADVVLPSAMWVETEGAYGNAERRTHFWKKMVDPPGEAKCDLWQIIEFAKKMGHGKLFEYSPADYPIPSGHKVSDASKTAGLYMEKAIWEEYRQFGLGHKHDLAPFEVYHKTRGLRWPVVKGKETLIRFKEGADPYVENGKGIQFYGKKKEGNKATVWLRPYEPPPEIPNADYPFWLCTGRVLEHWHSGTMTGRVESLNAAYPQATANMHPEDAKKLDLRHGDKIKISSKRGEVVLQTDINGRVTPQKGMVFVPWFDEEILINRVTLDAYCPISKQTDFKKCAVKIEKI
ncbi:nitrate reductase [Candidatus Nitromaritima sp. SCGC AAA799-A02]|nr:nitrate reductase [Candidatus Nitromaritima sp. SCGC AAA799-A02]KMP11434.1 nitrate reductase [Candidatus Nitromaritima sp. SCGC AAA799-C22]